MLADLYAFEAANDPDGADQGRLARCGLGRDRRHEVRGRLRRLRRRRQLGRDSSKKQDDPGSGRVRGRHRLAAAVPGLPDPFVAQSVPTAVIRFKDDAEGDDTVLVSELTGFPFIPGAARIHRVDEHGNRPCSPSGFTNIMDIVRGKHGDLWVLSIDDDSLFPPIGPSTDGAIYRSREGRRLDEARASGRHADRAGRHRVRQPLELAARHEQGHARRGRRGAPDQAAQGHVARPEGRRALRGAPRYGPGHG